ncbi:4-phosphoerythronate dehydrogenase [uncultured Alistipes sp.]|uniref:4-phosphoerythronate dehydrogenase n=1 Tax=uncultured Alistipes sp. TaxID=538949 RepID=UPI00261761C0|nr:4-phosphoerythronate dehydrogenase [uncultured Alistipes sp.]
MEAKPRIVADCDIPFLRGVLEPFAQVRYVEGSHIARADLADADALVVRTRTRCDEALLEGTPVGLIATATIGYDHIDAAYCARRGIEVVTAQGCNARGVLQYVSAALYELARRDAWRPERMTLGVVGAGNVGSLVAEYGRRFGFRVLCCDPPKAELDPQGGYLPLDELLPRCDIVTCHVPLTVEGPCPTLRMASAGFFSAMKPGAVFVNSSRGKIVCDEALCEALDDGRVSRAVIDTWNGEPQIDRRLLALSTLATPHIAGYSIQGKAAGTAAVVRAVGRRYRLPLDDWYPAAVSPTRPVPIGWDEMGRTMPRYFDIVAESERLKSRPQDFESIRNRYDYRTEFF